MVSQLGEEIKTQNVQQNTEVGNFRGRCRTPVLSYLGFAALGNQPDFLRNPNLIGVGTVSSRAALRRRIVE